MPAPTFMLDVRPDGRVWLLIDTRDGGSVSVDLEDIAEILHPDHAEVVRRAARMLQENYLVEGRKPAIDIIEWVCASHPWLPWPHEGACEAPGMPSNDRTDMHKYSGLVNNEHFDRLTRLLAAVRANDQAAIQAVIRDIDTARAPYAGPSNEEP